MTQKNKRMSDTNEGGYKQSVYVITGGGEVKLQRLRVDRNLFFGNISKEECQEQIYMFRSCTVITSHDVC